MRVGIITFHFVNNYGGVLQTFALQKTIKDKCNADAVIVDYRNWFIRLTDWIRLFPITTNQKEFRSGINTMKARRERLDKFSSFLAEKTTLTRKYTSTAAIKRDLPECDKFICGSDQIWNPFLTGGVAGAYYCSFVKERNRKVAYAPSFGTDKISPRHKKKMESYIKELSAISVREKDSIQYMKEHIGREAVQLIDPVFLVSAAEWKKEAVKIDGIPEKYILLYIMQRDETVYSYAKKLKEQFHLPIIEISRYGYQPSFVDISLINIGPQEFLGLFLHATYVVSNSYHGLIFSIVFDKKLCLVPSKRFRSRINNLLALLDRKEHTLDEDDLLISFSDPTLRGCILKEREKSIHYLQENIWS